MRAGHFRYGMPGKAMIESSGAPDRVNLGARLCASVSCRGSPRQSTARRDQGSGGGVHIARNCTLLDLYFVAEENPRTVANSERLLPLDDFHLNLNSPDSQRVVIWLI
jgi:hypothetical protein